MHEKSKIVLRLLTNRYHGKELEAFLNPLPVELKGKILELSHESQDVTANFKNPQETIKDMHYSWFIDTLKNIDHNERILLFSLLNASQASKLSAIFQQTPIQLRSSFAKRFLTKQLSHHMHLKGSQPIEYLPNTDLKELLKLRKKDLQNLIDFLGLHDLAEEIHHIVNKVLLEKIYRCLSARKRKFLGVQLHRKEQLITQRLKLEHWDGDCNTLKKILHHKGMIRLGYALSGQPPDLIWHITHRLDTGRAEKIKSFIAKKAITGVTETLKGQVKNILKFLNKQDTK